VAGALVFVAFDLQYHEQIHCGGQSKLSLSVMLFFFVQTGIRRPKQAKAFGVCETFLRIMLLSFDFSDIHLLRKMITSNL